MHSWIKARQDWLIDLSLRYIAPWGKKLPTFNDLLHLPPYPLKMTQYLLKLLYLNLNTADFVIVEVNWSQLQYKFNRACGHDKWQEVTVTTKRESGPTYVHATHLYIRWTGIVRIWKLARGHASCSAFQLPRPWINHVNSPEKNFDVRETNIYTLQAVKKSLVLFVLFFV